MDEIRLLQWHKAEGAPVEVGELLVELETEKVLVEVRAKRAAVLRRRLAAQGDWAKFGAVIALLSDTEAEPLPESTAGLPAFDTDFSTE